MTDWIQAWQCIGCGKIEAPQPCIGICRDKKILMVGKKEHERAHAMLQRFGLARPHEGQWERAWLALHIELREALTVLMATPEPSMRE